MQFRFGDYSLDLGRRELRGGANLIQIEPQVFDLLVYLIENRDRVVSKDDLITSVWGGRIVSDSTLTSRITAARKAIGDSGDRQALIRTVARKGIRFVGEVSEGAVAAAETERPSTTPPASRLRQEVHFCTAADGARIAYATVGQGPPVVKTANWLNHLEYDWESPVWSPLFQAIAAEHQLIRYDARGNGLSDWDVEDLSFEAFVRDLETVTEITGLKRFSLFGMSQGSSVAIAYAAAHPERVSHLVLAGSFARGRQKRGSVQDAASAEAMVTLMRQGWGQENPAFRQMFTSLFIPGGTAEQMQWWNDLQRMTTSPDNAVRLRKVIDHIDVTDLLPRVRVPTLVLHCRDDAVQPFDEGRRVAAGIPGARFVGIEAATTSRCTASRPGHGSSRKCEIFFAPEARKYSIPLRIWHHSRAGIWNMLDRTDFEPLFFAPFVSSVMKVEPVWIDYNGHLNMAYYNVLFDRCVDEAYELLGIGQIYLSTYKHSTFTAEAHVRYLREIHDGDPVRVTFHLLDYDAKRIHYFQQLFHAAEGWVSATSENMTLHVDMTVKKVVPFPETVARTLARMKTEHARLPVPEAAGRRIAMPGKS